MAELAILSDGVRVVSTVARAISGGISLMAVCDPTRTPSAKIKLNL
jgi:hypothetical protein